MCILPTATIDVLLSGRLRLDGYGSGQPTNGDGFLRLPMPPGRTVRDVIRQLGVPPDKVAMVMVNARHRSLGTSLQAHDRVILIPQDVERLWRFLCMQNLRTDGVLEL